MNVSSMLKVAAISTLFSVFAALAGGCVAAPAESGAGGHGAHEPSGDAAETVAEAEQGTLIVCGSAGLICCPPDNSCAAGLRCNDYGICRKPCGLIGEKCCSGQTCNEGACNLVTLTCVPQRSGGASSSSSGGSGGCQSDFDCPLNTICSNGRCAQQGVECHSSADCLGGSFCQGGFCCYTDSGFNTVCPFQP